MSSPAPFEPITSLLERSLNIKHVYGEPVQRGDTTVIPVAQVAYGFGAGGGRGTAGARGAAAKELSSGDGARPEAEGAGGGGGVRMTPVGALEIGPKGTRFIQFHSLGPLAVAAGCGVLAGLLLRRRRH